MVNTINKSYSQINFSLHPSRARLRQAETTRKRGKQTRVMKLTLEIASLTLMFLLPKIDARAQGSNSAHLLFKSGFGGNVTLGPEPGNGPKGYGQAITGTDQSTGFSWPIAAWSPAHSGLHLDPMSGSTDPYSSHFFNSIDTVVGHTGAATKALQLSLQNFPDYSCCAQDMLETSEMATPIKSQYFRVWIKFPQDLLTQFQTYPDAWRDLWVFKTATSFRMATSLWNKEGVPVWHVQADAGGLDATCGFIDPTTGAPAYDCNFHYYDTYNMSVPVPIEQWFLMEIYIKRSPGSNGRFFWAVDGQTLVDRSGPTYGLNNEEISNMYYISLYGNQFPMNEWLDDIEIWDAPPCATLPCGPSEAGSSFTGPLPPRITSSQGAVGAVGVPFSFQIAATNDPTNFEAFDLPPGLSFNQTTGLISGTPSAAGRFSGGIRAYNSVGLDSIPMIFRITD